MSDSALMVVVGVVAIVGAIILGLGVVLFRRRG